MQCGGGWFIWLYTVFYLDLGVDNKKHRKHKWHKCKNWGWGEPQGTNRKKSGSSILNTNNDFVKMIN